MIMYNIYYTLPQMVHIINLTKIFTICISVHIMMIKLNLQLLKAIIRLNLILKINKRIY